MSQHVLVDPDGEHECGFCHDSWPCREHIAEQLAAEQAAHAETRRELDAARTVLVGHDRLRAGTLGEVSDRLDADTDVTDVAPVSSPRTTLRYEGTVTRVGPETEGA